MGWSRRNRAVSALVIAAVVVAGCSSDDDTGSSPTTTPEVTVPSPPTTQEESAPTTEAGLTGEGFAVGLLAPAPGLLGSLFVGQERGTEFAVEDVDAGGGVLEGPLTITPYVAEAGAEPIENVQAAVDGGAQALIGPAGSDHAIEVRDEVAVLGSTTCSASATLPGITLGQEQLAFFRTALPDDVTTTYLAAQIVNRRNETAPDAAWNVAIVARDDEYGLSISNGLAAILQAAGLQPNVIGYNSRSVLFTETADDVVAAQPDLTVLVSYAEGSNLLSSLVTAGLDPATMIGLDAFFAPRIADRATASGEPTDVDGFQMLGAMGDRAFLTRLYDADPNGQVSNAAQAYDCAVVLSLATALVAAGGAETLGQAAVDVTGGGIPCTTYADCLAKLDAGDDIDYDGVSGQIALDENGDPTFARFTTAELLDGSVTNVSSSEVDIAEIRRQRAAYASAAQITKIQQALTFLGFYTGPINGLDTPAFQAALAAFQASVGLPATGVYDAATDAALRAALGPYSELLTATTMDIQRLMTDLGFYTGPIDGIWTQELTDSILAMQRELGVPETGVLDAATLRAVYARGVENGTTTTTTAPATSVPETTAPETTAAPETTPPPTTVPPEVPTTTVPIEPPQPSLPTLGEALAENADLSDYLALLQAAGYEEDLAQLQQYTMFAPTNDALAEAGYDVDQLIADAATDPAPLFDLLANTITKGRLQLDGLTEPPESILMLSGVAFPLVIDGEVVTIGGATVVPPPTEAFNGVIHMLSSLATLAPE